MGDISKFVKISGTLSILLGVSSCSVVLNRTVLSEPEKPLVTNPAEAPTEPSAAASDTANLPAESRTNPAPREAAAIPEADKPTRNYYRDGINRASSAVAIGQSAQSEDDWTLAVSRWQQAVDLLEQVPSTSPDYGQAQTKIQEYHNHLATAQQRAAGQPTTSITAQTTPRRPDGLVAQIPIQERHGGTPVVSVTMKGQKASQTFPMLFDTGATGTLITAEMAHALGVVIVDETQARIADGSVVTLPIGYITSIEVGGLRKEGMLVAIGGNVGLLGQDFYGEYGIAMGSNVINLHQ